LNRIQNTIPAAAFALALAAFAAGCGQSIGSSEQAMAEELQAKLEPLGVSVTTGTLVSLYGDDGGHLCAAADDDDDLANVSLAGHRFALRKTKVSTRDVAYARAVIEVYCPDELASFDDYANGLDQGKTSDD
jgi:hypothetical protein